MVEEDVEEVVGDLVVVGDGVDGVEHHEVLAVVEAERSQGLDVHSGAIWG